MNKIFENIAIATTIIVIGIIIISNNFVKAVQNKYYLNIDSNNKEYIEKIISENYKLTGTLEKIACMQGLGDWDLFLYYEDGTKDRITFGDSNEKVQHLHNHIKENGYNEGNASLNKIKISFLGILITIIFEISYLIRKRQKGKNIIVTDSKDDKKVNILINKLKQAKIIWNKAKRSVLFYTIIAFIIFIIAHFTLKLFNIQFRQWVYYCVILMTIIGIIVGAIQILRTKSKKVKIIFSIIGICIISTVIFYWQVIALILIFSYSPEHVITKDGKKYIAYVNSFLQVHVSYYDYINPFLVGNKEMIYEYYGKGGYDPFDGKHDERKPERYYYDNNGNVVKTNVEDYSKNADILENDTENNSENIEILYEKNFNDKIAIRVVVKDYILAGRAIIGIEKTVNSGNTWTEQIENPDGFIQIHNGAKFVFIDENIGFINDLGLVGTSGDNRKLLVTTNGKKFTEAIIKLDNIEKDLYVEDVPYMESNVLKLKAYIIENSSKKYYNFYSIDNGVTWKQQ